jgi:hypothetical protein
VQRAIARDESSLSRGSRVQGLFVPAAPSPQRLSTNTFRIPILSVDRFRHTFSEGSIKYNSIETADSPPLAYGNDGRIVPVAGCMNRNERSKPGNHKIFVLHHLDL